MIPRLYPRFFDIYNPHILKMKYLLLVLTVFTLSTISAQKFEWNAKSPTAHPNEVQPNDPARQAYDKAYNERQLGTAGIYNPNAQGTRTQYGEVYNSSQLTASHPLLPLGTIVRVQNLDNNRLVSVRINDRGQECPDCLLMLSQAAATQLGINYRGRVSVERTGFSNWNPALPAPTYNAPTAYNTQSGVARPVEINRNDQWQARGNTTAPNASTTTNSPLAYGNQVPQTGQSTYNRPYSYGTPAQGGQSGNYATLSAPSTPSVMSREVQPAAVSRQPMTYSRYPTAVTPTSPANAQPRSYQPSPRAYGQQQPTYQQPAPVPATQQAAPPNSTVARYQDSRTVPAPSSYNTPTTTLQAYNPPAGMTARGAAAPTAATPAAASGYVVQLGAYNNELYAKNRVNQLKKMGLNNVFYRTFQKQDGQMINRVYAGTFTSMAEAQTASRVIQGNYQIAGIVSTI